MKTAKKVNEYNQAWSEYSKENGTVNQSLVSFVAKKVNQGAKSDFHNFCLSLFIDETGAQLSAKVINKKYYKDIASFCKYGEEYKITRTDKNGCKTTTTHVRKCSEFIIFRYFWQLYKASK